MKEINKANNEKIEQLEKEIGEFRFKKEQVRINLKDLYLSMLKDEQYKQQSFIWIIKAMKRINDKVYYDMYPRYLDKENIDFLNDYARLHMDYENLLNISKSDDNNTAKLSKETLNKLEKNTRLKGSLSNFSKTMNPHARTKSLADNILFAHNFEEMKNDVHDRLSIVARSTLKTRVTHSNLMLPMLRENHKINSPNSKSN